MPGRRIRFEIGNFYHVFNRGVAKMPTFIDENEFSRVLKIINYYRYVNLPLRLSKFIELPENTQKEIRKSLEQKNEEITKIHCFVLMPNHFHFILEETNDGGISKFISQITNSYTRYFNIKNNRIGALFQGSFKAVLIESEEQLMHVSRYIHLNPFTDGIVDSKQSLLNYENSSLVDYTVENAHSFVTKSVIATHFKTKEIYKRFVLDHRDYQRKLGSLKKFVMEEVSRVKLRHL